MSISLITKQIAEICGIGDNHLMNLYIKQYLETVVSFGEDLQVIDPSAKQV